MLESTNTVKTWLHAACEEPGLETLRRLYALQLMPSLLGSVKISLHVIAGYVEMNEGTRKMLDEIVESQLAGVMMVGESLQVSLDQINRDKTVIGLITAVYEKRQFVPEQVLSVAGECLSVLTEENEDFFDGAEGIRLYSVLLGLPQDWAKGKAVPLTIRSLLAMSAVHGSEQDAAYEKCLEGIGAILNSELNDSDDVLSLTMETLANMMEGLDVACLAEDDQQTILGLLEQVCKVLSNPAVTHSGFTRGLGALTNLLVLSVNFAGDNVNLMIWNEAVASWLPKCEVDEEAVSGLLTVLRLLSLNLPASMITTTESAVQHLVSIAKPFPSLYIPTLMTLIPLVDAAHLPSGFDQLILGVLPGLSRADPEDLEELDALLVQKFGESVDPLSIRLEALLKQ